MEKSPLSKIDAGMHLESLFSALTVRECELLLRYSSEAFIRAGKALYYQGDEAQAVFLVTKGKIRLDRIRGQRKYAFSEEVEGSWLALSEVYIGLNYSADAIAVNACELRRFSRFNFFQLLKETWFKDLVLQQIAASNYLLCMNMSADSAIEKVASFLVNRVFNHASNQDVKNVLENEGQAEKEETTFRLDLTQGEIADFLGFSRETVNRTLKHLEAEGLLETERGSILIYDRQGLALYEDFLVPRSLGQNIYKK